MQNSFTVMLHQLIQSLISVSQYPDLKKEYTNIFVSKYSGIYLFKFSKSRHRYVPRDINSKWVSGISGE